jgi:hypothetical protein
MGAGGRWVHGRPAGSVEAGKGGRACKRGVCGVGSRKKTGTAAAATGVGSVGVIVRYCAVRCGTVRGAR